jgi:DNA-binding NtrC family response regulator
MSPLSERRDVLIIDDDPALAESLRMLISRQGHETKVARSAEEACELIASWQPAFAIVEVMLPGISGVEFAKLLQATYPACEIVLISGHPGTKELLDYGQSVENPLEILPKPVDPRLIVALAAGQAQLGPDAEMA